ncbi:MAG: hypothetical protein H6623_03365 [Bdellovibrionaceae bacterium]|nr:hypothetical protein [Pseudobdellovibrionaceae bacterium]
MAKKVLAFVLLLFSVGCSWFHREHTVIAAHGISFSDTYFSARLIEKLKNVDGTTIKDPLVIRTLKTALTEELLVEATLYGWAKKNNISFSDKEINDFLHQQLGDSAALMEAQSATNLVRDAVYIQLIQARVAKTFSDGVVPTEEALKTLYSQHQKVATMPRMKLRQIVVAEEHEADTLFAAIKSGKTSFEEAEKKFSLLQGFRPDDELPLINPRDSGLFAPLEKVGVGLYPRILKSHLGYHLVKVVHVKKDATQSFAALRPSLEIEYKRQRGQELYLQWLHDHAKKDTAVIDEPRLLSITAEYQETF